jgi:hypothetical protein
LINNPKSVNTRCVSAIDELFKIACISNIFKLWMTPNKL